MSKKKEQSQKDQSLLSIAPLPVETTSPGSVPDLSQANTDIAIPKVGLLTKIEVRKTRSDAGDLPHSVIDNEGRIPSRPGLPSPEELGLLATVTERLSPHAVAMIVRNLCQNAYYSYGNYQDWETDDGQYLPDKVLKIATNADFQLWAFPQVKVVLKANCFNPDWTLQVLVRIALHETIRIMAENLYSPQSMIKDVDPDGGVDNKPDGLDDSSSSV